MLRRTKAIFIMILSFVVIFLSFIIVSLNGVIDGQTRFYETFFIVNSNYINNKYIIYLLEGFFGGGFFVFLMPNLFLLEKKKLEFVLNCFINIIGFIIVCFLWKQQYYILMMIVICACIAINIILFSTNGVKKQVNIPVIVFTLIIMLLNIWMLCEHLIISMQWKLCGSNDVILNRIINISRANVFCFFLFFIPITSIFCQEIKINKRYRRI